MIIECDENNIDNAFNYIGNDYEKCLYMYIDLVKYGLENENFSVWIQYNENEICALISQYYNGIQIYSKDYNLIVDETIDFIKEKDPDIITGMGKSMCQIKDAFLEYNEYIGSIAKLDELTYPPNHDAYLASDEELEEIAKIIADDENLGKGYNYKSLYEQLYDRKKSNFGRNVISCDKSNNNIVCHTATFAELPELAVISGVITPPQYRGKGFSKGTLAALCEQLQLECKEVFAYFSTRAAEKMHCGVGFKKIGKWVKLKK